MAMRLRNDPRDARFARFHRQQTYEVLSIDVAQPLWPWLELGAATEAVEPVSTAAKAAYRTLLGGQWNPYDAGYSRETFDEVSAAFDAALGSASSRAIEQWSSVTFKHTTRESVVESQLHSGIMGFWHDRAGCRSTVPIDAASRKVVADAIRARFWPEPYEAARERLEDRTAYSEWDALVSSGYGEDEPAWIAAISLALTHVSVHALFRDLQARLSEAAYAETCEWCLQYHHRDGPYKGGNFKFDPTLFSDD